MSSTERKLQEENITEMLPESKSYIPRHQARSPSGVLSYRMFGVSHHYCSSECFSEAWDSYHRVFEDDSLQLAALKETQSTQRSFPTIFQHSYRSGQPRSFLKRQSMRSKVSGSVPTAAKSHRTWRDSYKIGTMLLRLFLSSLFLRPSLKRSSYRTQR